MKQCALIVFFITFFLCSCQNQTRKKEQLHTNPTSLESESTADLKFSDSSAIQFNLLELLSNSNSAQLDKYLQQKALIHLKNNSHKDWYSQKEKNEFQKPKDSINTGYTLLGIAELQLSLGDFNESQIAATEAITHLKKASQKDLLSYGNILLGLSYLKLQEFEKAIGSFEEAKKTTQAVLAKKMIDNSIGQTYGLSKNHTKAIVLLSKLSTDSVLDSDLKTKAMVLDNLGYNLFLNNNSTGKKQLLESLKIKKATANESEIATSHLHLSEAFLQTNPVIARQHADSAFMFASKNNDDIEKLKALELLIKSSESKEEIENKFSEYIQLKDKIYSDKLTTKKKFTDFKDHSNKLENEALHLKTENALNKLIAEKARNRNILTVVFMFFLIAFGYLFYRLTQAKHIKDKIKTSYTTELRISKKVHDELANDIYNIMNYANVQNLETSEKKETLLSALDGVYHRTRDISRENSEITLGENYKQQLKEMLSDYQTEGLNVLISGIENVPWNTVDETKKTAIYRVLQELMVNMKKHSQASLTAVKFEFFNKTIFIQYTDNGIGFKNNKSFFKNGLQNVENRILGISGTFTFDPKIKKGVKIAITCPQ